MIKMMPYIKLSKFLQDSFANQANLFAASLDTVEITQHQKLFSILKSNIGTQFETEHDFNSIKTVDDYRKKIPIHEYNDYAIYIERIQSGEPHILTNESVCCFEPTSGSTGYYKLIPYTQSLYQEFQNGIAPWLYDIYQHNNIASGQFYWSMTPAIKNIFSVKSMIPIGIENDFNYFSNLQKECLSKLSAVPFEKTTLNDINTFKKQTLLNLLLADDLSFISIWNPSFFSTLLDHFFNYSEEILSSLNDFHRRDHLKYLWSQCNNSKEFFNNAWLNLNLISCWADASAESHAENLKNYFPTVFIQGKGLISTEAFISFPFANLPGHILSIRSHFFEFKPLDETNNTYLAHELKIGKQYEVIVTTSGGLYRYNMHDIVEIIGYHKQAPLLKFVGRNHVIDLVGEKINELQLTTILKKLQNNIISNTKFLLCSPEYDAQGKLCYTVFLDTQDQTKKLHAFAEELEESLLKNFHYQYARQLNQLEKVRVYKICDKRDPNEIYLEKHFNDGKQLGQIKPAYIDKSLGWSSVFKGEWI
jgi:hypothetical protein